tara:strand:+ start:69 stop:2327 length:2259 start_codon:yes stop_codon:yes gene_type:complete
MKLIKKNIIIFNLLIYFIISTQSLYSSVFNISGTILDEDSGEPISNVNVFIENLDIGTTTDENGYFLLFLNYNKIDKINLNIQFIGYEKELILVELKKNELNLGKIFLKHKNIQLEPIQIHSHKYKTNQISDILLTGADLNENLKGNIASTLVNHPNIGINSYGIITSKPSLRGFSGDRFLLTKNGDEIGDLSQSSIDHVIALDMTEVESIEIIRGPKSLIYGPNAIGGVINTSLLGDPEARAQKFINKYMFGRETVNNSYYGNLMFYIPFMNDQINLFLSNRKTENQTSPIGELDNTSSKTENYKLGFTNYQDNGYLNFVIEKFNMDYGIPPNPGGHITGVDIVLFKTLYQVHYHRDISIEYLNLLDIKYGYVDYEHQELVNDQDNYHVSLGKKTHNYEMNLSSETKNLGLELNLKEFQPKGFYYTPKTNETELSFYGYSEMELKKYDIDFLNSFRISYLNVNPNLNNIQFNNLDSVNVKARDFNNISYSIGLRKNINRLEINNWFMSTMRSPRVEELYSDGPHLGTYAYEIGNPNLKIERIYGIENSISYNLNLIKFSLITFYNYSPFYYEMTKMGNCEGDWIPGYSHPCAGADFIDWGSGEFGFLYKYNSKGNEAVIKGLEINIGYQDENIKLDYDFSFVQGDNLSTNQPLSYINPMKQILDLNYKKKSMNYKIRFSKIHSQNRLGEFETYTPGVFLTDLILTYSFKGHNLIFQANNIFDKVYFNHLSRIKSITPEPGKNFHFIYKLTI